MTADDSDRIARLVLARQKAVEAKKAISQMSPEEKIAHKEKKKQEHREYARQRYHNLKAQKVEELSREIPKDDDEPASKDETVYSDRVPIPVPQPESVINDPDPVVEKDDTPVPETTDSPPRKKKKPSKKPIVIVDGSSSDSEEESNVIYIKRKSKKTKVPDPPPPPPPPAPKPHVEPFKPKFVPPEVKTAPLLNPMAAMYGKSLF